MIFHILSTVPHHLFMGFIIQSLKTMVTLKLTYLAGKLLEESFV